VLTSRKAEESDLMIGEAILKLNFGVTTNAITMNNTRIEADALKYLFNNLLSF
jgi:hypothetical protein